MAGLMMRALYSTLEPVLGVAVMSMSGNKSLFVPGREGDYLLSLYGTHLFRKGAHIFFSAARAQATARTTPESFHQIIIKSSPGSR